MRKHKGFTLVEILIVVVILGILAAIVIPQFSDASTQSKVSSSLSSLQSLRGQVSLYKIQHNDLPPLEAVFTEAMTMCSGADADAVGDYEDRDATNSASHPFGPYVQSVPANPWNGERTVSSTAGATNGWYYEELTGAIYIDVTCLDETRNADALKTMEEAGAVHPAQLRIIGG